MFVQSLKFVEAHTNGNGNGGKAKADISIFGQESNHTTWRLAKMNLAIRGIDANLGHEHADSFHRDLHPDLKADYVLANPPFNDSDWRGDLLKEDKRWKYGTPPAGNANYAWVQHFIHHLAPTGQVHEAYMRLVDVEKVQPWNSRGHFLAAAAEAMRRILIEHARTKHVLKRGGQHHRVELDEAQQ